MENITEEMVDGVPISSLGSGVGTRKPAIKCPKCEGHGWRKYLNMKQKKMCYTCAGRGTIYYPHLLTEYSKVTKFVIQLRIKLRNFFRY